MHLHYILLGILLMAELAACCSGLYTWSKWRGTPWRWFSCYLLFIFLVECFGVYTRQQRLDEVNKILYQYIVIPSEFLIIYLMFYASSEGKERRIVPVTCMALYLITWIADTLFMHKLDRMWLSLSYMVGTLLIVVLILRFFLRLAVSNAILSFKTNMMFWTSTGWLIFYLGSFPRYGLNNTVAEHNQQLFTWLHYLAYSLDIIMYSLFAAGFIWSKPSSRYS